jgi:hypothetical protein
MLRIATVKYFNTPIFVNIICGIHSLSVFLTQIVEYHVSDLLLKVLEKIFLAFHPQRLPHYKTLK